MADTAGAAELYCYGTAVVVEQVLSALTPVYQQCVIISFDYEVIKGDGTRAWFSSKGHVQIEKIAGASE